MGGCQTPGILVTHPRTTHEEHLTLHLRVRLASLCLAHDDDIALLEATGDFYLVVI